MDAFFIWDSAGHTAKSRYSAVATIPSNIKVKGINAPKQDGSYEWKPYSEDEDMHVDFLEYPMDMEFFKCALDYNKSVRGVISVLNYDVSNQESANTTINQMFEGMTDSDSTGYRGIAMHDPIEITNNMGFSANYKVGGHYNLDTLYLMNMMLPIGKVSVDFYATDAAYIDYIDKVKGSVSDSRIVPESNIQNGMGVFSGMARTRFYLYVDGNGVPLSHIAKRNCDETDGDHADSWDSKGCRLYQDVLCSGMEGYGEWGNLLDANNHAYEYYRVSDNINTTGTCYASNVKAAMMLDTTSWAEFLPKSISDAEKNAAYADGLKRYCVASNFENNSIADCKELKKECLETPEYNYCKAYLWLWCADHNWDMDKEQCRSALVSRYYLEGLKSSVIKREVQEICDLYHPTVCDNWCEKQKDGHMKCQ